MVGYVKKFTKKVKKSIPYKLAKRRYVKPSGNANISRIAADVLMLKNILNSEKKNFVQAVGQQALGQVNYNSEGLIATDITPAIPQGVTDSQRVGDSIKLHTAMFKFQIKTQGNTTMRIRGTIEIYQVLGTPQSSGTFSNQLYIPTPFIIGASIRDYNSMIDQDYRQQYKLIAKRNFIMAKDNYAAQHTVTDVSIPVKFGKTGIHIKYAENTTTTASGQLMMIIRVDGGNSSATTASTLSNIMDSATSTGLVVNRSTVYYYYDN